MLILSAEPGWVCALFANGEIESLDSSGAVRWTATADACEHCAAISADQRWVAAVSALGTITVLDAESGEGAAEYHGQSSPVRWLAFTPDSSRLVSWAEDRSVRIWSWHTARVAIRAHEKAVSRLLFAPQGQLLSAGDDDAIRLWDLGSGSMIREFKGHSGPVEDFAVSEDGKWLVSAAADRTIRVWELGSGGWLANRLQIASTSMEAAESLSCAPVSLAIAPGGAVLAADIYPAGVFVRSLPGLHRITEIVNRNTESAVRVEYGRDGKLAVSGEEGQLSLWSSATPPVRLSVFQGMSGTVRKSAFSLDGRWFAAGDTAGVVRSWSVTSGEPAAARGVSRGAITALVLAPGSTELIAGDSAGRIWRDSLRDGRRMDFAGHRAAISGLAITADGDYLLSVSVDGTGRIWKVDTGDLAGVLRGHSGALTAAAISPDGKSFVTAGEDGFIRVFRCPECAPLEDLLELSKRRLRRKLSADERKQYLNY